MKVFTCPQCAFELRGTPGADDFHLLDKRGRVLCPRCRNEELRRQGVPVMQWREIEKPPIGKPKRVGFMRRIFGREGRIR